MGKRDVPLLGPAHQQLSAEQLAALIDAINDVGYFNLNDQYINTTDGCPVMATDNPSAITRVKTSSREKSIHHYYGCQIANAPPDASGVYPEALYQFEARIDAMVPLTALIPGASGPSTNAPR
ncbi:hypothetical protein C7S18_19695 [Ahniella affigens]|uniref:DUF6438 domain-containing protein n=1 Tax=Ahniella affigens TaxID=2021234 RepID=A0A2P1PWN6_9GAMM|nr:hypothetical protein C7S18_19695 [Ahniella affigens]